MSTHLADRMFDQLTAARQDAALARHNLEIAQDAAHVARTELEGIADDLAALGLHALSDKVHAAYIRLREADPYAASDVQIADVVAVWG
jgi:hypothetical protein